MHQSVEECARGDNHSLCSERYAPHSLHTYSLAILHNQLACFVLPYVESFNAVESCAPFPDEFATDAMCSRAAVSSSRAPGAKAEL